MKQITSQRMRTQDNWMIFVLVKTRMLKMKTISSAALGLMEGIKKLIPALALVFYSLKKCGQMFSVSFKCDDQTSLDTTMSQKVEAGDKK